MMLPHERHMNLHGTAMMSFFTYFCFTINSSELIQNYTTDCVEHTSLQLELVQYFNVMYLSCGGNITKLENAWAE